MVQDEEHILKEVFEKLWIKSHKRRKGIQKGATEEARTTLWLQIGIGLVMVAVTTLLFPSSRSIDSINVREGDVYIGEEIIAPFTFAISKNPDEYQRDLLNARNRVPQVYTRRTDIAENQVRELRTFLDRLYAVWRADVSQGAKRDSLTIFFRQSNVVIPVEDIKFFLERDPSASGAQSAMANRRAATRSEQPRLRDITTIAVRLYAVGILDQERARIPAWAQRILVRSAVAESDTAESFTYYFDLKEAQDNALQRVRDLYGNDELQIKVAYKILTRFLKPNIIFDREETETRIAAAEATVPLLKDQILESQRIIDSHEKVTTRHVEILRSLYEAKTERAETRWINALMPILGRIALVMLSLSLLTVFLQRDRKKIFNDPKQLSLVAIILLSVLLIAFAINQFSLPSCLIPIAIASMLLTIFFDSRIGFLGTVSLAIILGGMRGNDFAVIGISIFAGSMAIVSVTKVRKRNWIIRSMVLTAAAYLLSVTAVELLRYASFTKIMQNWGFGLINGILSPVLTYGLLVVFETVFDTTTDMTFLELSDLNHPLLRKMALDAPGTYHHSIIVGNLVEAAVENIGGNGLLARVGAYYHDIGKLEKPDYFVENQKAGRNPQEKLSPSMSALILINHVRRGAEMAEEYNLPREIRDFIEQHHGTSLMAFFYHKAREQNGDKDIRDTEFRYPGPRPQSREAGILMLADAVEAASRTLKEPSVTRIKTLVSQIIDDRFQSGELDDCPLTLRDLNKIGEVFSKILIGWFHSRIVYPEEEKKSKRGGTTREKILEDNGEKKD